MATTERRTFEVANLEVRSADGQPPTIHGYAVVFDSWSEPMLGQNGRLFRERILPTAFDRALSAGTDVRALWNHNSDMPLGRTRNGTLIIERDAIGLRVSITPADTTWGRDAVESIRRGDVSGMSFSFQVNGRAGHDWLRGENGLAEHVLIDADLYEVSPVVFPAYRATSVDVRSVEVPEFSESESDSQAADEIDAQRDDGQVAVVAVLRQRLQILAER